MRKRTSRLLSIIITTALMISGIYHGDMVRASDDYSEVVSFREVDKDIMLGTTANSPFSAEDISKYMDLEATLGGKSVNVNTTTIDATDLTNWQVYDHYDTAAYADEDDWLDNYAQNPLLRPYYSQNTSSYYVASTDILSVDEAIARSGTDAKGNVYYLKEHIAASSNNGNADMKFYGYPTSGYADFLFYPAHESGTKKVQYTIDSKNVKTHSLRSAGFMFNCGINADKLYGYVLIFTFKAGEPVEGKDSRDICASGISEAIIMRMDGIYVDDLHGGTIQLPNYSLEQLKVVESINLSSLEYSGHFDISNVTMDITDDSVKITMTEAGEQVGSNPYTTTLFDFQSNNSSGSDYNSLFQNFQYGGFGPIVSYSGHACEYTSYYIFSNLKMSIEESESVLSGLSNADFTEAHIVDGQYVANDKYYVLIGDNSQDDQGYKDFFKRDFDDVYLEMLKKQGITLITNLNINNISGNINGTDYNLKDYLGESNVIRINGSSSAEIANAIENAIKNSAYSKQEADNALDALDPTTGTGHNHSTAKCVLTYQGLQVERVNINRLGSNTLYLDIDDSKSINVTNPVYKIKKPDGSIRTLPGSRFSITNNATLWPAGEYTVMVEFAEKKVAKTSFSIYGSTNAYFNLYLDGQGTSTDNLYCEGSSIGLNKSIVNKAYSSTLYADTGFAIPKKIKIYTDNLTEGVVIDSDGNVKDANGNAVILTELTEGIEYTYNSVTGAIEVMPNVIQGNVYISAHTGRITCQLFNVSADKSVVTGLSKYDTSSQTISLSPAIAGGVLPPTIKVVINDQEWSVQAGSVTPVLDGQVEYNNGTVTVSKDLFDKDIKIVALAGNYKAYYSVDRPDKVTYGDSEQKVVCGQDYDNEIYAAATYKIDSVSVTIGDKVIEGCYSGNETGGNIHIDGADIINDININISTSIREYSVQSDIVHGTLGGANVCNMEEDYQAKIASDGGYVLPDTISVKSGGVAVAAQYIQYNWNTGDIVIKKMGIIGDVVIQAECLMSRYSVTYDVENLTCSGVNEANSLEDYQGLITPEYGYSLPDNITVTVGTNELNNIEEGYSYNNQTGDITIYKSSITDNIVIEAAADKILYSVTANTTNASFDGADSVDMFSDYEAKLTARRYYELPANIIVTSGGNTLTAMDYIYNPSSGELVIPKDSISGDIVIEAEGYLREYNVTVNINNVSYSGDNKAYQDRDCIGAITADEFYELPENIVVAIVEDHELSADEYTYDSTSGEIVIPKEAITGDIVIVAEGYQRVYNVTTKFANARYSGDDKAYIFKDCTGVITADEYYEMPESIVVSVGNDILSTNDYIYNRADGTIVIPKSMIKGDILIEAAGYLLEYNIRTNIYDITYYGDDKAYKNSDYNGKLTANMGFNLPSSIIVQIGNDKLSKDDYSYDSSTGNIVIPKELIAGEIWIYAVGEEIPKPVTHYQVTWRLSNLTGDGSHQAMIGQDYSMKLVPAKGHNAPETIQVIIGGRDGVLDTDYKYNVKTGDITIPKEAINGDIVIQAYGIVPTVEQPKPDTSTITIIPPKYENSYDGKVIGVTTDMEYSTDGGKTWIPCMSDTITGLGTGRLCIRLAAWGNKKSGVVASIDINSSTLEYYIPTIDMSKKMGFRQKFQLKIVNTKGADVKVVSTDKSVVTVNRKGIITSKKKEGKAKVVITIIKDKHIVQYVANVTVSGKVKKNYSLKKFSTNYKAPCVALYKKINAGKSWRINMTHDKNAEITYSTSNSKVATVTGAGVVKGIKSGNARITVQVNNNGTIDKYYIVVRVAKPGEKSDMSYLTVLTDKKKNNIVTVRKL